MSDPATDRKLSFGQIALENKLVSREQILECLEVQKRAQAAGQPAPKLGELMVQKGYLSDAQVRTIFRLQGREGGHRQIAGYQVLDKLGGGGMGAVYKAKQLSMDRLVAIKILAPHLGRDERFVSRFLREARAVARLSHVNIIAGIDVGESNGIYYFAMEFVDGPTLGALVREKGTLPVPQVVDVTLQACRALEHAHRHGMVHRDIKPENLMLTKNGTVKLCDLGLARVATDGAAAGGADAISAQAAGTPAYIAPETASGRADVDIRADLYSLGATAYHLATGEPPFVGPPAVVLERHRKDPAVPAHLRRPGVSKALSAILVRAMEKALEDRYQTPAEMAADLERIQRGEWPIGAGPPAEGEDSGLAPAALPALPASPVESGEGPPAALPAEPVGGNFPRRRRRRRR